MNTDAKNYYEILEIPTTATPKEIHHGYMRAKNAYSQDSLALYSLMSQDECDEVLNLIEEAYHILSDPNKRKEYDAARGINVNRPIDNTSNSNEENTVPAPAESTASLSSDFSKEDHPNSMSKLVAKNRFSLQYETNSDFEKEIEQATEWTGTFLKQIREYKNVDINRMADMTKVSKTYIRYIEDESFDLLPAPVYVRGFVYQYAKCLKLNPELVATSYLYRLKQETQKA